MPTARIKYSAHRLLEEYNAGQLPEVPRRIINGLLRQNPPYWLMRRAEDAVHPIRLRVGSAGTVLDYMAPVGRAVDEWDLIIAAVFAKGDGHTIASAQRCAVCGDWGWWPTRVCPDCGG